MTGEKRGPGNTGGIRELNKHLRAKLNPAAPDDANPGDLRVGDRVINTVNQLSHDL